MAWSEETETLARGCHLRRHVRAVGWCSAKIPRAEIHAPGVVELQRVAQRRVCAARLLLRAHEQEEEDASMARCRTRMLWAHLSTSPSRLLAQGMMCHLSQRSTH